MKKAVYVEFFGLPGAGKSYISELLYRRLKKAGYPVASPVYRLTRRSSFVRIALKFPLAFFFPLRSGFDRVRLLYYLLRTRQKTPKDSLKVRFNYFFTIGLRHVFSKKRAIVLFDQGVVQALFSVLYSARRLDEKLLSYFPLPDVLIEVKAERSVILERLRARKTKQSRVESDPETSLLRAERIVEAIKNHGYLDGAAKRIEVCSRQGDTAALNEAVDAIIKEIDELFDKAR